MLKLFYNYFKRFLFPGKAFYFRGPLVLEESAHTQKCLQIYIKQRQTLPYQTSDNLTSVPNILFCSNPDHNDFYD